MAMRMRSGGESAVGVVICINNPIKKHASLSISSSSTISDLDCAYSSSSLTSTSPCNSDPDPELEHIHGAKKLDLQTSETESIPINYIREKLTKQDISTATESTNLTLEANQLSSEVSVVACVVVVMLAALYAAISSTDRVKSWGPPVWMAASLSCSGIWAMVDRLIRMVEAEGKARDERISGMHLYMDMETLRKDAVNSTEVAAIKARLAEKLIRKPVSKPGLAAIPADGWITVVSVLLISLFFIFSIIRLVQ